MNPAPMTRLKHIIAGWFRGGFVPSSVHAFEWALMRLFVSILVVWSLQTSKPFTFDAQPWPRGLARLFDLTFLHGAGPVDLSAFSKIALIADTGLRIHGPGWFDTVFLAALVAGVLYTWGRGLLFALPLLALAHTIPWTLYDSQGYTHHGHQLLSMILVIQSVIVWWWKVRHWRRKPLPAFSLPDALVFYSQGMIAVAYVTCAITKLVNSKGLWLWKSNNICIEIIKSRRLDYYSGTSNSTADAATAALWLLNHPWTTRILFDSGFFIELFAFIALRSRVWSLATGLAIISFHRSVWALMRLEFPEHERLIFIFLVNVPYWIWWLGKGRRSQPAASPAAHAAV